jgi:hypothetical protein
MEERTTKGHLMISVITLVLENYPTRWTVDELTLATGEKRRRVERLIKELADRACWKKAAAVTRCTSAFWTRYSEPAGT